MLVLNRTAASPGAGVETRCRGRRVRRPLLTRREEGQALVEFAFTLPLLMIMVMAIFWFGITLNHYLELTNAVGIGGELISVSRGQYTDPCANAVTAIQNAAPLLTPSNITYTFVLTPQGGSAASNAGTCSGTTLSTGEQAQITATYPCTLPFSIFSLGSVFKIQTPSCTLTAQVTELIQ